MSIASLKDAVQYVRGVGPRRGEALARLGLREVWEVLWHAPRHYFDRSALAPLGSLVPGREVTVRGCLRRVALERTPRGFTLVKAWLQDETGSVLAVWFNQAYLVKVLRAGQCLYATGRVHLGSGTLELRVAEFEVEEGQQVLGAGRIVPVYPAGAGLSQKVLRQVASQVLETYADQWPEVLSPALRRQHGWPGSGAAFRALHFPESHDHLRRARERLAYEELVLWQWALLHRRERQRRLRPVGREQAGGDALVGELLARLPFTLTAAQRRVVEEIVGDLRAPSPMNRLLQGDVGSGKTVVAAIAAARTVGNGLQVAFMAPTEILAQQHFDTLSRLLQGLPLRVELLTGRTGAAARRSLGQAAAAGEIDILVGTHALIQDTVRFARLGLVVIDEQHRFGVRQRSLLVQKGEVCPDTLVMSATPIPRTLAMCLFGDMDVSVLDELPPGRRPVRTYVVRPEMRRRVWAFLRQEVARGRQAYIVCPLVEESEAQDLQAATALWQSLAGGVFADLRLGLLHGRLKAAEKAAAVEAFRRGETDILVTTTVVEVGVDVPNATVMVV
ncbi:MAG: ATP-dependent DNA helicase RecG, partial [Syntrophomonadaceae bacterium]|nr:ATP-dependent DNA helicase RecG [Syntrophomonadaceae bacterium]